MRIKIDNIAKTEGHTGFVADILEGNVKEAKLATLEGARLFEGIVNGRYFEEVPEITSRICGICPVVHVITAIKAIENAYGVKPSESTILLRKILLNAQNIHSHTMHLYFLSLPDFLAFKHDKKLLDEYPARTSKVLELRKFGTDLVEVIGGRVVHPLTPKVGGFYKFPAKESLKKVLRNSDHALKNAKDLFKIFNRLTYPKFERETEFFALNSKEEYALYEGELHSSEGVKIKAKSFKQKISSIEKPYDAVKKNVTKKGTLMVGALARLNVHGGKLNDGAKEALESSRIKLPEYNSFYNLLAQAIEVIHYVEEIKKLSSKFIKLKEVPSNVGFKIKEGEGTGACEAPRGTLYHHYKFDKDGRVADAEIVTPTSQMLVNIEEDLKTYIPSIKEMPLKEQKEKIKAMIRAYDPCISCATH